MLKNKKGFSILIVLIVIFVLTGILLYRLELVTLQKKQNSLLKQKLINEVKQYNSKY
ncbi:MAG: hypothetical protein PHV30_07615 [Candidatus Margulisbacteria bacterium]|nr:hypothetical protein [Candidatus Margulisiibacteriota bacterium]